MLQLAQVESSLLFCAVAYISISFFFKGSLNQSKKRKQALWKSVFAIALLAAAKLAYDVNSLPPNLYAVVESERHHSSIELRRTYKTLSKKYHPDKNPSAEAQSKFQEIKAAYDVLMDEEQRDAYNRFGEEGLVFDPRKDEMKLVSDLAVDFLFWAVVAYTLTLPRAARASRTWIAILGIALLAADVFFKFSATEIPDWVRPATLTEFELLFALHSLFPVVMALLRALSESLHVDVEDTSTAVLKELFEHQKKLVSVVRELEGMLQLAVDSSSQASEEEKKESVESILSRINAVRGEMESYNENFSQRVEDLRSSSSNPGSNYYWIVFVLLYGGIMFL